MENQAIECTREFAFQCTMNDWTITCFNRTFKINHNGIVLIARNDECLKTIKFDIDNKTIELIVAKPKLPISVPRKLELKGAQKFFEEIRLNLELILMTGTFSSVKTNEERTIFEIE